MEHSDQAVDGAKRETEPPPVAPKESPAANLAKKTPMYEAYNASRYHRQELIRAIENRTQRSLICYVAGIYAPIDRDDVLGFVDLLHNIPKGTAIDLLLHTGGGDIDAAEKLTELMRIAVEGSELRVIVPDFAKSAGTLIAIGADLIRMSDPSELGPIDPQVTLSDSRGNRIQHSVQSYLDAYDSHVLELKTNPDNAAAQLMLSKLDPATEKLFRAVNARARTLAERLLKKNMQDVETGTINYTTAASALIDTKRWLSHGQMISWQAAQEIGLNVEYVEGKSEEWREYWRLYCLQRLAVQDRQKLFESKVASLVFDGKA